MSFSHHKITPSNCDNMSKELLTIIRKYSNVNIRGKHGVLLINNDGDETTLISPEDTKKIDCNCKTIGDSAVSPNAAAAKQCFKCGAIIICI